MVTFSETQLFMSTTGVVTPHWLLLPEEVTLMVTFSSNAKTPTVIRYTAILPVYPAHL